MNTLIGILCSLPNMFFLQLAVADLLFSKSMRRRDAFSKRVFGFGVPFLALSIFLLSVTYRSSIWFVANILYYILTFFLSLLYLWLLFDEKPYSLLLCAASGYMTQHIASQFCQALITLPVRTGAGAGEVLLFSLSTVPFYFLIYIIIWQCFAKNSRSLEDAGSVRGSLVGLSAVTLAVVLVLSAVRDTYAHESFALMIVTRIFSVFCCVILLYMRAVIIERRETESENELLKEIGELREKQYTESKETIELINIKAHDIRHQLGKLHVADRQELREIVNIYDSVVKTGNDTLDTLLTEKSIFCEKHGIRLSCMVDGGCIDFMTVGDICSLFGNAIENAIEAVLKIEEQERRIIAFRVREKMGMVVANIDNNYSGDIELVDGLPKSTKGDDRNHGFGVKSIRRIAEKYNGEVTITLDDMFHLAVLIPKP